MLGTSHKPPDNYFKVIIFLEQIDVKQFSKFIKFCGPLQVRGQDNEMGMSTILRLRMVGVG